MNCILYFTDGLLDVSCKVDRDLFKEPMCQPRPVRIRDSSRHRAISNSVDVQVRKTMINFQILIFLKKDDYIDDEFSFTTLFD